MAVVQLTADSGQFAVCRTWAIGTWDGLTWTDVGETAALSHGIVLTADPGSLAVTGVDAAIVPPGARILVADTGAFAVTGVNGQLLRQGLLIATAGVLAVAGVTTPLLRGGQLAGATGALAANGVDTGLTKNSLLVAAAGDGTIAGQDALPSRQANVAGGAGAFAVSGIEATLTPGRNLSAAAGGLTVSGADAALLHGATLPGSMGGVALTGVDAPLLRGGYLTGDPGSLLVSGLDANPIAGRLVGGAAGSFAVAGADAGLTRQAVLAASLGTCVVGGLDAGLLKSDLLAASAGALVVSGGDAALSPGKLLPSDSGSAAVTGLDASLLHAALTTAATGGVLVVAVDAAPLVGRVLSAATASVAVTGVDAAPTIGKWVIADGAAFLVTVADAGLAHWIPEPVDRPTLPPPVLRHPGTTAGQTELWEAARLGYSGTAEPTYPSAIRFQYVVHNSVTKSQDLGSFENLLASLSGRVGASTGTNTLYFRFRTLIPARIAARLPKASTQERRWLSIGFQGQDNRPIPLDSSGFAIPPAQPYGEQDGIERLLMPADSYYVTLSSSQWTPLDYKLEIVVLGYSAIEGDAQGALIGEGRLAMARPEGVVLCELRFDGSQIPGSDTLKLIDGAASYTLIDGGSGLALRRGVLLYALNLQARFSTFFYVAGTNQMRLTMEGDLTVSNSYGY